MHLLAPHGTNGRGTLTGWSFKFDTNKHGILHQVSLAACRFWKSPDLEIRLDGQAAIDVANPEQDQYISRFALTTSTGSFQLWQQDHFLWLREESLGNIEDAAIVDFPLQIGENNKADASKKLDDAKEASLPVLLGFLVVDRQK